MGQVSGRLTRDSIHDVWGSRSSTTNGVWPPRVDEHVVQQPDRWVPGEPYFKYAAARMKKASSSSVINRVTDAAEAAGAQVMQAAASAKEIPAAIKKALTAAEGRRPLALYLGLLDQSERHLSEAFRNVAHHHGESPDIQGTCLLMAGWSAEQAEALRPIITRYGEESQQEPDRLRRALFEGPRTGGIGLLRDLHDLWLAAAEVHLCYEAVRQAGRALHELVALC